MIFKKVYFVIIIIDVISALISFVVCSCCSKLT